MAPAGAAITDYFLGCFTAAEERREEEGSAIPDRSNTEPPGLSRAHFMHQKAFKPGRRENVFCGERNLDLGRGDAGNL